MKKIVLIALLATMFGCTKVTQDGGRALDNANGVVSQGGPKVWKGDKVWDGDNKAATAEKKSCGCPSCKKEAAKTCNESSDGTCSCGSK